MSAMIVGGGLPARALSAAAVDVSGAGWWHSRELRRTVELLVRPEQKATLDAGAIEDGALILVSELQDDGYLRPRVTAIVHRAAAVAPATSPDAPADVRNPKMPSAPAVPVPPTSGVPNKNKELESPAAGVPKADFRNTNNGGPAGGDGEGGAGRGAPGVEEYTWDETLATFLPRPLEAASVAFRLTPGVRYQVAGVAVEGLTVLPVEEGEAYFRSESYLLPLAATRVYTPARFDRALSNLQEELRQRGYAAATVEGRVVARDDASGDVQLKVVVNQGPRWTIARVVLAAPADPPPPDALLRRQEGRAYSPIWEQGFSERVRSYYHDHGYMDVHVELAAEPAASAAGRRPVTVQARIEPGQRVLAGPVRFTGPEVVKPGVLRRQSRVKTGEPLNPAEVAETRDRLVRLGVFRTVDVDYDPADGPVRSPVFTLTPGRDQDFNLLGGWGSYEKLRGGIEYRHYNVLALAHQVRVDLVQSMKSSRGEMDYLVPDLFGESIDGTATLFGLRRDEHSFTREEYGGSVGAKRHVASLGGDVSLDYTYQSLGSTDSTLAPSGDDVARANVASLDLAFLRDHQDNPLRPRRGYRVFVRSEFASKYLGGEVDYQRLELGVTAHWGLGRGRWFHAGLSHGVVTTFGGADAGLPVNKRFFPGGENTVRGFPEGGAAPRAPDGSYIGAKTYLLVNLEFEQALTRNWSAVVFADAIGVAARLADYPFDQKLGSIGVGVRYHSLIGPIRLEYGHNINPRTGDPAGTLHFSVGFPF